MTCPLELVPSGPVGLPHFPLTLAVDDPPPPGQPPPPPVVAFYGDSFSSGYAGMGAGERNWTTLAAHAAGATPANNAIGGTGYVQCPGGVTFPSAAADLPVPGAAVQVVMGGFNDRLITDPAAIAAAARTTFRLLRLTNPAAGLLVIGPQWPNAAPPALMYRHRDAVRDAALRAGAAWVDPLDERWLFDPGLIWPGDGIHPTDDGHQAIARWAAPHLAAVLAAVLAEAPAT